MNRFELAWKRMTGLFSARGIAPAGLGLLLCLASCSLINKKEKPVVLDIQARAYPDQGQSVKRVLLIPFINDCSHESHADAVSKAFGQALAERGIFEVVTLPSGDEQLVESLRPFSTGRISASILIELGSCYHVDAVLMGHLKSYEPYAPPAISMKADLISIYNGETLRTVNGILDARDHMVTRDVQNYFLKECSHQDSLFEWRRVTSSPEAYTRYVCHRFVDALYPETRFR